MFCIPESLLFFKHTMKLKILQICAKSASVWGRCREEGEWGREKQRPGITSRTIWLQDSPSAKRRKINVLPKWIAHKMLNEVSIRGSLRFTIIWWKESDFSGLQWAGMLKKSVAKYYIWRTAAACFVVSSTKAPWQAASWCKDWDAAPKPDYKKINSNAHSQVLGYSGHWQ